MIRERHSEAVLSNMMSNSSVMKSEALPLSPGQRSPRSPLEVIEECDCKCAPSKQVLAPREAMVTKVPAIGAKDGDTDANKSIKKEAPEGKVIPVPCAIAAEVASRDKLSYPSLTPSSNNVSLLTANTAVHTALTPMPEAATVLRSCIKKVGNSSTASKPRPPVTFSKLVQFQEIRHINDHSEQEISMIWNTPSDYQVIKAIVKKTIALMMKGVAISDDDGELCTRGLEFRTKVGSRIRARNKLRARSAVLNEQDMQRDEGFYDPHFIAMAAMEESLESRQGARARGLYDAEMTKPYMLDTRLQYPEVR